MSKITVGMPVLLKPVGNRARFHGEEIQEYVIKKVGRKYFEVWKDGMEYTTIKFHIDSFEQVTDYTPDWRLYCSMQEIIDEKETQAILDELRDVFKGYGRIQKISLVQLRKIKEIISEG
ncbi:hypothetical protein ACFVS2_20470 [Brevibacillus sp. NPDC058079]|uniref:beta barrel domain-containing protein n=1 Tax=Brevibacillus sp. NPDC058079 TaxID=3346330 RepID=UPI0036E2A5E6